MGVTKKITEGRTQVLLLNKEETALAGLFSDQRAKVRKGIPILKDLPWWFFGLKYLTGYDSQSITKKELIILIRAEVVPSLVARAKSKHARNNTFLNRKAEFNKSFRTYNKLK
jgi:type IV pilus assembly protein PilQ